MEAAGVYRLFRRVLGGGLCALTLCDLLIVAGGCAQTAETPGQLVVTFQTDMAMPEQIDNLLVLVTRYGRVDYRFPYPVGPASGQYRVPGTLTLVAAKDGTGPITVTVAGSRNGTWRTFREVVTTIPAARVAELRMPVQWLCNESAMPQLVSTPDGMGGVVTHVLSNCDDGTTCKAGSCVPNSIDSSTLPDFAPENVFGGAADGKDGQCFATLECLSPGAAVAPDPDDCTIAKPDADDDHINVGLRVADGGICDATSGMSTTCFVPLDRDDVEGWRFTPDGERLILPPAVCGRIAERKVLAVYTSSLCPTKTDRLPPCGEWSSVPSTHAVKPEPPVTQAPGSDSGPALSAPSEWPSAELVTTLLRPGSKLCCPLMSEQGKLYTCACPNDGSAHATLLSVDPNRPNPKQTTFEQTPSLAAVVHGQTLYWAEEHGISHVAESGGAATPASFSAPGTVYTSGVMLADDDGVYALTTGTGNADPVLLLRMGYDGAINAQDPLGNRVVKQFAQDGAAFYAGLNVDQIVPSGQPFQRISSVVRIDKASHARSTVLKEQTMTISDEFHNGFLGVVTDGSTLFAQFETVAGADGNEHLQIVRVDAGSGAAPEAIYDLPASPNHYTVLQLLGAVDGALIFARYELEANAQKTLRSSSVMTILAGSTSAHFIADFAGDSPTQGLAVNDDRIFWLNQTGRLFGFDRKALRASP